MDNKPVVINGQNVAWADISLILFGVPVSRITDINYTRKRARKNNYAAGAEPVSYSFGNIEYEGDITLFVDEVQAILATAPGTSILEIPPFSATVMAGGNGIAPFTHKLKNISFTEDPFTVKQGATLIEVKIPFVYAGLYK